MADFRRRRGVAHTEILLPNGSASWLADRERLWNCVETMERRIDAQLAREINLALPHELDPGQRLELLRGFVCEQFVARGMVADIAIHHPVPEKGDDPRNVHAHILLTLRQATAEGLRRVKTREWNSDACLLAWRRAWAEHQNRWLQQYVPRAEPVDHRRLTAQRAAAQQRGDRVAAIRLDRLPELHIGVRASHAARRGRQPIDGGDAQGRGRRVGQCISIRPRMDRAVLPPRLSERRIRYSAMGAASRLEANRRRLAVNHARYDAAFRYWQGRSAFFGKALHRRRRAAWQHSRGQSRLLRRIALLQRLIALIEAVLAALLTERDRQSKRLHSLQRSGVSGLPHRQNGGRNRWRRRGFTGSTQPRSTGD